MRHTVIAAAIFAATAWAASATAAEEPLIWSMQAEQLEYRLGDDTDVMAWDADARMGTDELKLVLTSKGEFERDGRVMESLEHQLRLQKPVSDFFDAVAGVRVDTPEGPDRIHGVVGLHGLAPQWFEVDADLFMSDHPSLRLDVEYELLLTNHLILTPSVEVDLPFTDDREIEVGAWGPKMEIGARLSYDLVDRAIAPYIGVHYERVFGETRDIARAEGKDGDALFFVAGTRLLF